MDVMDAINRRRSVRDYASIKVDEATIRSLITAAVAAPTAVNRQAWSFVVVTNRDLLKRWSASAKAELLANLEDSPQLAGFRDRLEAPDFDIFYNAPVLVVICATDPDPMAAQSVCLAAENLMLAARALGLGSCWIGFAEAWLNRPEARAEMNIPTDHIPVAPLIVGRPSHWPEPPTRHTPEITWIES